MSLWTADQVGSDADPELSEFPLLTYSLLLVLVSIFVVETNLCGGMSDGTPSIKTLISAGGLSRDLVFQGQWFRTATSLFLHAGPAHILSNCVALFLAGKLELILGRTWFLFVFLVSGLGGALLSMTVSDPETVSVGASGAILGLLVVQLLVAYGRYEESDPARETLLRRGWGIVIPTLAQFSESGVDVGAHFGGSITGFAIGAILLLVWDARFSRAWYAVAFLAIGVTGALLSWGVWALAASGCSS